MIPVRLNPCIMHTSTFQKNILGIPKYFPADFQMDQLFLLANICFTQRPEKSDAIFIHAREGGESIRKAAELYEAQYAPLIIINGLGEYKDYIGRERWLLHLREKGIPESSLEAIVPATNTKREAEAVVALAKARQWTTLMVVAQPYHIVRSWLTFIDQVKKQKYQFKVITQPPSFFSWHQAVLGSQAEIKAPRWQVVYEEAKRISRYQDSRELAVLDDALEYHKKFFS